MCQTKTDWTFCLSLCGAGFCINLKTRLTALDYNVMIMKEVKINTYFKNFKTVVPGAMKPV